MKFFKNKLVFCSLLVVLPYLFALSGLSRWLFHWWYIVVFHKDVSGTIVYMFETIRSQENTSIPAWHHNQHVVDIQNLWIKESNKSCYLLIEPGLLLTPIWNVKKVYYLVFKKITELHFLFFGMINYYSVTKMIVYLHFWKCWWIRLGQATGIVHMDK